MADLFQAAFNFFVAYEKRADPLDCEVDAMIVAGLHNKSYRIRARQIMFALAYHELGDGNQEAFFRLVQEYNKTAMGDRYLGPKQNSSAPSLREYLKKAQKRIQPMSGQTLRQYQEMAYGRGTPNFFPFYLE